MKADSGQDLHRKFMYYYLSTMYEIGSASIDKLEKEFPDLEELLNIEETELKSRVNLEDKQIAAIINFQGRINEIREEYAELMESDIHYVTSFEPEYPQRLLNIKLPPKVLFYKGELPPEDAPAVSIVGSRACTGYGQQMTEYIAESLAERGVSVISGLAAGIDAAAHKGAMKSANGKTYGILGTGVNVCYPRQNYYLFNEMATKGRGGVISELVPGNNPLACHFPMRNRIISGLSDIVIVAEARLKSGSLITADFAMNQGRDVMALPGRATDPMSAGCNQLIQQGAGMVLSPENVLYALGMTISKNHKKSDEIMNSLAKGEKIVYSTLDLHPKYIEEIVNEVGMCYSDVISILLNLEVKGLITQFSGNYYGIIKKSDNS